MVSNKYNVGSLAKTHHCSINHETNDTDLTLTFLLRSISVWSPLSSYRNSVMFTLRIPFLRKPNLLNSKVGLSSF